MDDFYFDASALVKRYSDEPGTEPVNHIFDSVPLTRLMCLTIGATEVVSILVRKRNDGRMSPSSFSQAFINVHEEVIHHPDFATLPADDPTVVDSIGFIVRHSINATDAIVLVDALQGNEDCQRRGEKLILVSSDQRLNRAAQQEGLAVFNPETDEVSTLALKP